MRMRKRLGCIHRVNLNMDAGEVIDWNTFKINGIEAKCIFHRFELQSCWTPIVWVFREQLTATSKLSHAFVKRSKRSASFGLRTDNLISRNLLQFSHISKRLVRHPRTSSKPYEFPTTEHTNKNNTKKAANHLSVNVECEQQVHSPSPKC